MACTVFAQRGYIHGGRMNRHMYYRPQPYVQQVVPGQVYRQQSPPNMNNRGYRNQNPEMRKIQAVKEGFISRQLNLTTEQAQRFWPVYRQYQNEVWNVKQLKRLNNSAAQANGSEQIKKDLDYEAQLVDIKKHYNDEFLKVLPPEKVSEIYKSERAFTDELVRRLHEHPANAPE
jgi:hypothetical protein